MEYIYIYLLTFLVCTTFLLIIEYNIFGVSLSNRLKSYMRDNQIYFIICVALLVAIIVYVFTPDSVTYFLDENEASKALANVEGTNVTINNPNVMVPDSFSKAVSSLGVGGSVAAGITTAGAFMKSGAPMGIKLGVTAVGGAIGGALFVSANYMNTIAQRKAEKASISKITDSFSTKSMFSGTHSDDYYLNAVLGLLDANFLIHVCMVYLLICLLLLYISNNVSYDKIKSDFLKKLLKYISKTNKL